MGSDRDVKPERRRSFFLFGSVNLGKSDSTTNPSHVKQHDSSVLKHIPAKGALDKKPLNNKNPFVDNSSIDNTKIKTEENTVKHSLNIDSANCSIPVSNARMRARKPPPPIDMESIRILTQTAFQENTTKYLSQTSSTDETLKSASNSPAKTPVPIQMNGNQHRRQRSEAEKLVDDLDEYIKLHENSGPFDSEADESKNWPQIDADQISSEHSSDVPSTCVEPLDITPDNQNASATSFQEGRSEVESEQGGDSFSFTGSLTCQSVNSIQQIAMSEFAGAAPVSMNLHYGSLSISSSNHSGSPVNASVAGGKGSASSDDEFREAEQQFASELPLDETSSQSGSKTPKRVFRVVNEDRAHFYLDNGDNTTFSTSDNTTADEEEGRFELKDQPILRLDAGPEIDKLLTPVSPALSYSSSQHGASDKSNLEPNNQAVSDELDNIGLLLDAGALTVTSHEDSGNISRQANNSINQTAVHNNQSLKREDSNCTTSTVSSKPDKTVRLVSSYVEELRLKYYRSSNFLAAPPDLPISLKQKNNLIQPKNIKVKIRTSSKQIGIKHGGAKQKLLSLETANEHSINNFSSAKFNGGTNRVNVDHTKEFHDLLAKEPPTNSSKKANEPEFTKHDDDYYLENIPGDDAYDSDDAMAPLRKDTSSIARNNTVVSYYTKNQRRFRSGTLDNGYAHLQDLPTNITVKDYEEDESLNINDSENFISDDSSSITPALSYGKGQSLHVANPDADSD
ncbi:hypothetical protein HG537_0G01720 [Torulaspora globosa]|uniref:Uncharacterized protein n=1 Tax=Torulaspora globosa TaxID=48254 RepID=A0A7H9HW37_9SACH|nr:hypothetical protein HG537_0G01720 [Torulaspora sp. CBS 2947]